LTCCRCVNKARRKEDHMIKRENGPKGFPKATVEKRDATEGVRSEL